MKCEQLLKHASEARTFRLVPAHVICAVALAATPWVWANEPMPAEQTRLTEAQVREKYQNCPNGYYSGPRPGKARYTKDNFLWVVTPEFARKFCMPPEFVSAELKGAEAVAFRIVEDADEEICGWGGREQVCARMKELRFEIYLKNGLLSKERNVPYFNVAYLPSTNASLRHRPRMGCKAEERR